MTRHSNTIKAYNVDENGEMERNPRQLMFSFFNGDYKVRRINVVVR